MTQPCRCTDTEICLNCQSAAKSAAFILNRKRNEARHAICEAGYVPCANRIHYVPGNPEGDPIPRVAMHRDKVNRPLCTACHAYQESVVEPIGAGFHARANSYKPRRAA